jgi:site-specific recombinase XerD
LLRTVARQQDKSRCLTYKALKDKEKTVRRQQKKKNGMNEFINYMERKNHAPRTQGGYIKLVENFLRWYGLEPVNCTKKDILDYLAYLKKHTRQQNSSRRSSITALNHYFTALVQAGRIDKNPAAFIKMRGANKRKLYKIYTPEELMQLADNFYHVFISGFDDSYMKYPDKKERSFLSRNRDYAMLTFLLFQGLTTTELTQINLDDIDMQKARLRLNNGTTIRNLPVNASQMGALINYINNIRPLYLEYCKIETDRLFFSLSAEQHDKTFSAPLRKLTGKVKSIDGNFVNFAQIRASVITHWIQTEGLRKAQYLAGHRRINSTEMYLQNDLNSLMNDIQKFNPF